MASRNGKSSNNGAEVPVAHLGPGAFFGEMSLLTGEPRAATIRAETDALVLSVGKAQFAGLLKRDPGLAARLAAVIGSVHFLPGVDPKVMSPQQVLDAWWDHTQSLAATGIDILAHPFRWIHKNGGVPVTMEMVQALVELARRNAVALEINADPSRLDLDEVYARRAAEMGILLSIDTDAHSTEMLEHMEYGVSVARRAWVGTESVLNTWPAEKLVNWLQKRE